jgi:phosphatidylethanolamine/phosphatidyl-N-methylethanolamine N-methyltransferase
MDASQLEFEDNYFDGVLATYVLSVVDDPARVMQEMCRVCKPGGTVYVFNHFKSQKDKQPLLAMLEKTIAPSSKLVGFHADFSHELLQAEDTKMQLVEQRDYGPLGLFTLLKFKKPTT